MHRLLCPLALFIVDVDNFKHINDTFVHPTGDKVLRKVAQVLKHACRETDIVARFRGNEFALLLPGTDPSNPREFALKHKRSALQGKPESPARPAAIKPSGSGSGAGIPAVNVPRVTTRWQGTPLIP